MMEGLKEALKYITGLQGEAMERIKEHLEYELGDILYERNITIIA